MLKSVIKLLSIFAFLALGVWILQIIEPTPEAYSNYIDTHIRSEGYYGILLFIAFVTLFTCFAIPRQLLSFVGGYAFGAFWGTLFVTCGIVLACVFCFYYSRFVGQSFVQKHFGNRIQKMEVFLRRAPVSMTLVIRLLPVGNNLATNLLAGVTHIPAFPFFLGSSIGYIPQNFIFSLLGSGVHLDNSLRTLISALLLIFATLFGLYLYKKHKNEIEE